MESPDSTQLAKEKLAQAVDEVNASRKAIFDKFDKAASEAADIVIDSMKATASDKLELGVKRLHKDAAKDVLKLAGFDIERTELRLPPGGEGFKVVIVDYGNDRNNNPAPAQTT